MQTISFGGRGMILECHNLSFAYSGSWVPVIKHLSFSMKTPGFNGLFGPSGVGKTSLARLLADPKDLFGKQIITRDINTILYSYNLERLPDWSSIGTHLARVTPKGKEQLKEKLVDIFQLKNILSSRFSNLSMGQQNRINLIRYLLQDFDLLILDESLANVDEKLRQTIILSIKNLFKDKMFLYISHNLMEVSTFCSQVLVFGSSWDGPAYSMARGLDCKGLEQLDKAELDRTMLEMMNAV